ncbi:hypothetical protein QBC35DRAFT_485785 [Podospora australis]|uniref:Uncharacterized protein n=1 Tax=Podospora australis TaxID=1536484 RepID=A0AAN6X443_9PEZI|nr:hypothetical protein QBC35DRAFT_485785 [Podospora australis]
MIFTSSVYETAWVTRLLKALNIGFVSPPANASEADLATCATKLRSRECHFIVSEDRWSWVCCPGCPWPRVDRVINFCFPTHLSRERYIKRAAYLSGVDGTPAVMTLLIPKDLEGFRRLQKEVDVPWEDYIPAKEWYMPFKEHVEEAKRKDPLLKVPYLTIQVARENKPGQ